MECAGEAGEGLGLHPGAAPRWPLAPRFLCSDARCFSSLSPYDSFFLFFFFKAEEGRAVSMSRCRVTVRRQAGERVWRRGAAGPPVRASTDGTEGGSELGAQSSSEHDL